MNIFRTKNINDVKEAAQVSGLKKSLTAVNLIILGIGAVIGTGIFVITGPASQHSGPALTLSFMLGGIVCMFVALVYTEIASAIPTSGSVYTYSYIALGELAAWITAMLIIMEFSLGATTVAAGWSGYMVEILRSGGVELPKSLTTVPSEGGIINLPSIIITLIITAIVIRGTKESALINNILVVVKLSTIALFILIAAPHWDVSNLKPFAPHGFSGIVGGAAIVFLAFAGFDSLAAAAEECKNPKRDMTIGLIGSLVICTIVYMAVAAMLTGIVPYTELNNAKPLAHALSLNGSNIGSALVAAGGVAGMTTVLIVNIYAQSRVFYVMARDGLLPKAFSKIHTRYNTPYVSTLFTGLAVALISGLVPIHVLGSLASFGTLAVFMVASVVVIVLRIKMPNIERPFKCPTVYLISTMAILSCGFLMIHLIPTIGKYFLGFLLISIMVYFVFSARSSARLNDKKVVES